MKIFVLILCFLFLACETKPKVAPNANEFRNSFYSLNQSGITQYQCDIIPKTLAGLSDFEMDALFKNLFNREASIQERGMLRKLKWRTSNSNEKQDTVPSPRVREFPTNETADIAERLTHFLNLINKLMTLIYLENFADRPDLKKVVIDDKFFKVISNLDEVAAEVDFNKKKYRIFYGEKNDVIEITMQPLGSMQIPSVITLPKKYSPSDKLIAREVNPENIDLFFELFQGIPRLTGFTVYATQLKGIPLRFAAENCEFTK